MHEHVMYGRRVLSDLAMPEPMSAVLLMTGLLGGASGIVFQAQCNQIAARGICEAGQNRFARPVSAHWYRGAWLAST